MKSKFALTDRLGLTVTSKMETNFNTTERTLVNYVIADELEAKLQDSKRIYFNKAGSHYSGFRVERQPDSMFAGIIIGETQLVHCREHDPVYKVNPISQRLESVKCGECGIELSVTIQTKERE